jgi:tetratricopeptide (TPR) repeat protein
VALAAFITEEARPRGERVEPRRDVVPYRFRESQAVELARADSLLDRALAAEPNHVEALMWKAMVRLAQGRHQEAEGLVTQVLARAPNHPEALRLHARFRIRHAGAMAAQAASLRSPTCSSSTTTERRSDGVYEITRTTCTQPTPGDLQRAAALEAQAAEYRRRARQALEAAVRAARGTVDGFLIQAELSTWLGQPDQALAALQQAVTLDPKSVEAHEALADFLAKSGQADRAEEQLAVAVNLIHTTAAPYLRLAWARATKQAWQGAKQALAAARQLDPADARAPAYLGVVLLGEGQASEALAAFRTALALEEARLALDEQAQAGGALTRDALDFGLPMALRLLAGSILERAGQADAALALYRSNVAYDSRIARPRRLDFLWTAMLPDPKGDPVTPPQPLVAAAPIAQSHVGAGRVLAAQGRTDDARRAYAAAMAFGPLLGGETGAPRIGTAKEPPRNTREHGGTAIPEAAMWLIKDALARGQGEEAGRWLGAAAGTFPPGRNAELEVLQVAIRKMLQRQRQPAEESSPERRRLGELQREQDERRARLGNQHLLRNARVDPALVGVWEMRPENRFLPWRYVLTIEANAAYTMVSQADGATRRGRTSIQGRGGVLLLVDESGGDLRTLYYEMTGPDAAKVTDSDGTKYELRRR